MVFFTCDLGELTEIDELTTIQNTFNSLHNDVKFFLLKNAVQQYNSIHNVSIQNCESETINSLHIQHIKETQSIKENYEEKINTLRFEIYHLEKNIKDNQQINTLQQLIEQLKNDKKILLEDKNSLQKRISQLENNNDTKIQQFIDKMSGTAANKGSIGENIVQNFISKNFALFDIIDTSSQTSKGDLFITNTKFNLLVENKNIQSYRTEDFNKFYRDVEINALSKNINAALYISLYDIQFPNGRRGFFFERKFGIPIILISNVYENMHAISFSIQTLLYLVENGFVSKDTIQDNQNFELELSTFVSNVFSFYESNLKLIDNDKKYIYALLDNLQERTNVADILISQFKKFNQLHPQFFNKNDNNNDSIQKIIQTLPTSDFNINDITYDTLQQLGFSHDDIKSVGGIKPIKNAYKIIHSQSNTFKHNYSNNLFSSLKDKSIHPSKITLKLLEEIGFKKEHIDKIDNIRDRYKEFLQSTQLHSSPIIPPSSQQSTSIQQILSKQNITQPFDLQFSIYPPKK